MFFFYRIWLAAARAFFVFGILAISPALAQGPAKSMFVPGELIVGYKTPADRDAGLALLQAKQGLLLLNGEEAQDVKVERLGPSEARLQVTLPAGIKALAKSDAALERKVLDDLAAKLLAADATILYAHPNWITTIDPIERSSVPAPRTEARDRALTADAPNDPYFTLGRHWHYQPAPAGMNALGAWRRSTGEQTIVVAIIDTGIVSNHGDVAKQNLLPGYTIARSGRKAGAKDDADCTGYHGSHVAGTVGLAGTNNGLGIAGINWHVEILPIRVFDSSCTGASTVDVADAIRWAAGLPVDGLPNNKHPAQVINLSVGASVPCTFQDNGYQRAAVEAALAAGTVIVAAAGNDSQDFSGTSPASCPGVISVAAHDANGRLAWYSNYGAVTITAPGGDLRQKDAAGSPLGIWSLVRPTSANRSGIAAMNGTSMAAPHVSGAIALAMSANAALRGDPSAVAAALKSSAAPLPAGACPKGCGAGLLDAQALVSLNGTSKDNSENSSRASPAPEPAVSQAPGADSVVATASVELDGVWASAEGVTAFEIEGRAWRHPKLGLATFTSPGAGDAHEVIYQYQRERCSYRINGVAGGGTIVLTPIDPLQSPEACPTGRFSRAALPQP